MAICSGASIQAKVESPLGDSFTASEGGSLRALSEFWESAKDCQGNSFLEIFTLWPQTMN